MGIDDYLAGNSTTCFLETNTGAASGTATGTATGTGIGTGWVSLVAFRGTSLISGYVCMYLSYGLLFFYYLI